MKKTLLAGLCLALFSVSSYAQEFSFPDIQGFEKITKYPVYLPENLWDFINGAADTYLALGFVDLHVAEYKKGREVIKLEIYKHSDNTMAFGIYASERSPSYNFIEIGSQGYAVDGVMNFFKGSYYVKIRTNSEKPKTLQAEESLARRVEALLPGEKEMPALLSLFPKEGRKMNEETFINESVLGHQFLNKAFRAVYQEGNDTFNIYLIKSPSAEATLKTATSYLAVGKVEPDPSETRYAFADGYNGTVFLAWKNDILVIISGLAKDQADIADKYASEILK